MDHMLARFPGNPWAVRTGRVSGIVVLDFDVVGLSESLDEWETWMDADWRPPADTLVASTPSGGRHFYYAFPRNVTTIRSRNRVLPGLDIKADGGYVVVPYHVDEERRWVRPQAPVDMPGRMVEWLTTAPGSGGSGASVGHGQGYDYEKFLSDGCPEGSREEFFNDLIFRLRRRNTSWEDAYTIVRRAWRMADQPPVAKWEWPWNAVMYKLQRVWATVVPADTATPEQRQWAEMTVARTAGLVPAVVDSHGFAKIGRVTIAPPGWVATSEEAERD
jgi:hypothetical protein